MKLSSVEAEDFDAAKKKIVRKSSGNSVVFGCGFESAIFFFSFGRSVCTLSLYKL